MLNFDDEFPMTLEREFGAPETVPQIAVSFGLHPMLNARKSAELGREYYDDVEFVKIAVPGDKNSLYFQPAQDSHRRRFPKSYADFKARASGDDSRQGMPIESWAPLSRSMALNLRAANIHTVEALAQVHDGHIDRIGQNGRELREKAKAFLAQATDSAATMRLAADKKVLEDQLAAMQAQIVALTETIKHKGDAPLTADQTAAGSAAAARTQKVR